MLDFENKNEKDSENGHTCWEWRYACFRCTNDANKNNLRYNQITSLHNDLLTNNQTILKNMWFTRKDHGCILRVGEKHDCIIVYNNNKSRKGDSLCLT